MDEPPPLVLSSCFNVVDSQALHLNNVLLLPQPELGTPLRATLKQQTSAQLHTLLSEILQLFLLE